MLQCINCLGEWKILHWKFPDFHTQNLLFSHYLEVSAWNSRITALCPQNPQNKSWLDPKSGRCPKRGHDPGILEAEEAGNEEEKIKVPNVVIPSKPIFWGVSFGFLKWRKSGLRNQGKVDASVPWLDNPGTLLWLWGEKKEFFSLHPKKWGDPKKCSQPSFECPS